VALTAAFPQWHRQARGLLTLQHDQLAFIDLALARNALRFGQFTLKSGRDSPYFFNAGLFSDGEAAAILGRCYAAALMQSGIAFDMLFGPAYKGIPLVTATSIALYEAHERNVPFAFNRKEAKEHGEGGNIVGSALAGRVVIVDDVIAAGTAKRESIDIIRAAGATPVAILLALDRQERGQGERSAAQELEAEHGIRCVSILTFGGLIEALGKRSGRNFAVSEEQLTALKAYRARYGVS
jgi:orotate phosphoribosyltransferase